MLGACVCEEPDEALFLPLVLPVAELPAPVPDDLGWPRSPPDPAGVACCERCTTTVGATPVSAPALGAEFGAGVVEAGGAGAGVEVVAGGVDVLVVVEPVVVPEPEPVVVVVGVVVVVVVVEVDSGVVVVAGCSPEPEPEPESEPVVDSEGASAPRAPPASGPPKPAAVRPLPARAAKISLVAVEIVVNGLFMSDRRSGAADPQSRARHPE